MRVLRWLNVQNVKEFFWSSFFLASALLLAVLSQLAQRNGAPYAAASLAILSLLFAAVICVTLVPKLLIRLKLDFLNSLQFFRFTRRGAFFILIILIIALSTFNTGNNLLILVLSFLLASLVVSGLVSNVILQGLKVSLNIPDTIYASQRAVFFLTLHNLKKSFPSFALRLKGKKGKEENLEETDFFVQEKNFPYVRAGERLRLKLHCEFSRRGTYPVDGFEVTTTFPFGFFARGRKLEAQGNIVVYPALCDLIPLFMRSPSLQGSLEQNRQGLGSNLFKIREYQSGDSARFVHWKSTAKLARPMIKDFAHEEENPIQVVFSTYLPESSAQALQQFEKAVSYIATLAHHYQSKGQKLHFRSGECEVVLNGREDEYRALMRYLASVQPSDSVEREVVQLTTPCILFAAGDSAFASDVTKVDYLQL